MLEVSVKINGERYLGFLRDIKSYSESFRTENEATVTSST